LRQISNSNGLRHRKSLAAHSRGFHQHCRLDFLTEFSTPINDSPEKIPAVDGFSAVLPGAWKMSIQMFQ
jgi:hypothetical protein